MDIHEFAAKWLLRFKTEQDLYEIFDTLEFSNDARAVGLVMDTGHSFLDAFPEIRTLNDLDMIKTKRDDPRADIQLIGAAIYSQWRYVNHWSDESPSEKDREWFIYMLGWLEERSCNCSGK